MKKLIPFLALATVVAWAGSSQVASVGFASAGNEPTSATAGLPTSVGTSELRRLILTAKQPDDAGIESQDLSIVRARAWKYTLQGTLADGGTLFRWSRFPDLDMAYTYDGGTVPGVDYPQLNSGVTLISPQVPPMGNGSRIAYTVHNLTSLDAGAIVYTDLILEGRYLPEMAPR